MSILLVHGWGFDPGIWAPLRSLQPARDWRCADLGYFGPADTGLPPGLELVVGHSFGCLWAMGHPGLAGVPLLAVNGFTRFAAAPDFPHGTPPRVLARMLARLGQAPGEVLRAFHDRCGTPVPEGEPRPALAADLARMAGGDARADPRPVKALAAADDPLVPPAMSRQCFPRDLTLLPQGGHVLPLTRPGELARAIGQMLG
jgi:pimeloyl-ACP methyl ester carboxylesterase